MTATAPLSSRPPARAASGGMYRFLAAYGLLALLLALIVIFSLLLPETFPTAFNARSILSDKSIIALLALAEMVPIATNQFDLSIGYHIGLAHILAVGLQVNQGVPWPVAVVAVLAVGALVGLINGLLVTRVGIDAFIATLGVGT
ncbi:MAG TPA: hypothetical protein VFU81_23555, partial [Thermomicrobiales bacterium]|nr:hypothetical protein [Thermomicrobiales bacterium]